MHQYNPIANFSLAFSQFPINAFVLSRDVSHKRGQAILDDLPQQDMTLYSNGDSVCCDTLLDLGLQLRVTPVDDHTDCIHITVDPGVLLSIDSSLIGNFDSDDSLAEYTVFLVEQMLDDTLLSQEVSSADLDSVNIYSHFLCDNDGVFHQMARVLRKSPAPAKYERIYSTHKNKNNRNKLDKHYIHFSSCKKDIVIYDSTVQKMVDPFYREGKALDDTSLQLEVQYDSDAVAQLARKKSLKTVTEQLSYFISNAHFLLADTLDDSFGDEVYYKMEELQRIIDASSYKNDSKQAMLDFSKAMASNQKVEKVLKSFKADGVDTKKMLENFRNLGINPVPLEKDFYADALPGIMQIIDELI